MGAVQKGWRRELKDMRQYIELILTIYAKTAFFLVGNAMAFFLLFDQPILRMTMNNIIVFIVPLLIVAGEIFGEIKTFTVLKFIACVAFWALWMGQIITFLKLKLFSVTVIDAICNNFILLLIYFCIGIILLVLLASIRCENIK